MADMPDVVCMIGRALGMAKTAAMPSFASPCRKPSPGGKSLAFPTPLQRKSCAYSLVRCLCWWHVITDTTWAGDFWIAYTGRACACIGVNCLHDLCRLFMQAPIMMIGVQPMCLVLLRQESHGPNTQKHKQASFSATSTRIIPTPSAAVLSRRSTV